MAEKQKNTRPVSKVIDVSQPGKAAPSASSRPVIVGNKSIIQDPMVSSGQPVTKPTEPAVAVKRTSPQVIAPLSEAEKPAEEAAETAAGQASSVSKGAEETAQGQSEQTNEKQSVEPSADTTASSGDNVSSESSESSKDKSSSIVDAVVDQASKDKDKKNDKKQEELNKRQAEIDKLIEEKKYFVPIANETNKRRKTRWAVLLLVVLLFAAAYLVLDAQVIKNDIQLPYEFFTEEQQTPVASSRDLGAQEESQPDRSADGQGDNQQRGPLDSPLLDQVAGRDANRKNELKDLQYKLESYFSDNGAYPTGVNWATELGVANDEITGPKGDAYLYESNDGRAFTLKAQLEDENDPDAVDGSFVITSVNQ